MMRIAIGSDSLGFDLKARLSDHLAGRGLDVVDFGCDRGEDVDYPDVAEKVARAIAAGDFPRALLVCGTGLGMAIAANKVPGVRAASLSDAYSAERARKSNDAQVLCLGSLVVGEAVARLLVDVWLEAEFAGGRSGDKIAKIAKIDGSGAPGLDPRDGAV